MAVDTAARNDRAFCMFVRLACRCELFRFLVNKRASPPCISLLPGPSIPLPLSSTRHSPSPPVLIRNSSQTHNLPMAESR